MYSVWYDLNELYYVVYGLNVEFRVHVSLT